MRRLSLELAEAASGAVLWGRAFDMQEAPLFETQDRIAAQIALALVPRVQEAEQRRMRRRPPEDLNAYHLVLKARELSFPLCRDLLDDAGRLLRKASALDPGYSSACGAMAAWHGLRLGQGWSTEPETEACALEDMARAAIVLDGNNAPALALLGHNRAILHHDFPEAVALLDRALEAAPNESEAWMWSCPTFAYMGESQEAVRRGERAIALSPQDPFMFRHEHFLSISHYAAGAFDAAAYWGKRSHRRNPQYTSNLRMTAASLAAIGRQEEARPLTEAVLRLQPGFRVGSHIARQAFRDHRQRTRYGQHLVQAGLPA